MSHSRGEDLQSALAQLQQAAALNKSRLMESAGWERLEGGDVSV